MKQQGSGVIARSLDMLDHLETATVPVSGGFEEMSVWLWAHCEFSDAIGTQRSLHVISLRGRACAPFIGN